MSDELHFAQVGDTIRNPTTSMGYQLGRVLGEGAFGVTFECVNEFGEPLVAKYLKPFRPREQTEQEWRKEAHLMAVVRHPNIIAIYDWFEFGNRSECACTADLHRDCFQNCFCFLCRELVSDRIARRA